MLVARVPIQIFSVVLTAFLYSTPSHAELAFTWANKPSTNSYSPAPLYTSNPKGGVLINRAGAGTYQIVFENMGSSNDTAGSGGHVQVSAYQSASRCGIVNWGNQLTDLVVNVYCFQGDSATTKVDSQFTVLVMNNSQATLETGNADSRIGGSEVSIADFKTLERELISLQSNLYNAISRIQELESR